MSELIGHEFGYRPPSTAAEHIEDLLDDSIADGQPYPERRQYIDKMLGAMYENSGMFEQMQAYKAVFSDAYRAKADEVYGGLELSPKIFDIGSKLAIHSMTAAIRDPEWRTAVRRGDDCYYRTEFGALHTSLTQQQHVLYFGDFTALETAAEYRSDMIEALKRAIDELYDDLPTDWQPHVVADFMHGFIATDTAIKQYLESLMMEYRPDEPIAVNYLPLT